MSYAEEANYKQTDEVLDTIERMDIELAYIHAQRRQLTSTLCNVVARGLMTDTDQTQRFKTLFKSDVSTDE